MKNRLIFATGIVAGFVTAVILHNTGILPCDEREPFVSHGTLRVRVTNVE
jgi:hypothetical protein